MCGNLYGGYGGSVAAITEPAPGSSHSKENDPISPPKKRPKSHMSVSEKFMVVNCYKYTHSTWPTGNYWSRVDCAKKVAQILGISDRTVRQIMKEHKTDENFSPPNKPGPKLTIIEKLDEFTFAAIRRTYSSSIFSSE